MTERPHYKALYLKAEEEVRRLKLDNQARINDGLQASRERAMHSNNHRNLHRKMRNWLEAFRDQIMVTAIEKDGWLQFPMMVPEDAAVLRKSLDDLTTYLDRNPPTPM